MGALSTDDIERALGGALRRSAPEGARLVTLHWLRQLQRARNEWAEATLHFDDTSASDADASRRARVDALHRARVALRRLRASLAEHESLLKGSKAGRVARRLSRIQRASNAARDADVHHAWLSAEGDALPANARLQADVMRDRLQHGEIERRGTVSAAFRRHFDDHIDAFAKRLARWRTTHVVGAEQEPETFASHLADRIDESADTIQRMLIEIGELHGDELPATLHRLRIHLKRQRALLSPHASTHRAIGAWYDVATRGQDLLGAMRDAAVLSARARYDGADELASALGAVALSRQEAFLAGWAAESAVIAKSQQAAAAALRAIAAPQITSDLPLEIERKYLLTSCPPQAAAIAPHRIDQGWLPGTTLRERLRRTTAADGSTRYTRTIKLGPARARIEIEEDTDQALFNALWPMTLGARIEKLRHVVPDAGRHWEIDVFLDRELFIAEIELDHEYDEADPPEWLKPYIVREVTGEPQYFNAVLARVHSETTLSAAAQSERARVERTGAD